MKKPENLRDFATGRIHGRRETVEVDGKLYTEEWVLEEHGEPGACFDPECKKALRVAWQLSTEEEREVRDRAQREEIVRDELGPLLAKRSLSGQEVLTVMVGLGKETPTRAREKGWTR